MKIYDYDRRFSPFARYGDYEMISRDKLYIIKRNHFTVLILRKSIIQNRPFKILYYALYTTYDDNIYIQQDIITNNRYLLERKKYMNGFRDEFKEFINHFRYETYDSKFALSELDIHMLYRIMNHFIRKNRKRR